MTCRHAKGDPACSSTVGGYAHAAIERENEERHQREIAALRAASPDAERYEIVDLERVGPHLVLKVQYPNCAKCSYEGNKVMVFLDVTEAEVLRWKRIDPHFRAPPNEAAKLRPRREAPGPAARFPASPEGWSDALAYAHGKVRAT